MHIMSCRRLELASQLKQWHLKVIEIVKRGQHRKSLDKLFQGFKPAVESCYFNWEVAYPLEGITYYSADKKNTTFCWPRSMQFQRGVKPAPGAVGEPSEPGGGIKGENSIIVDYKGRGNGHFSQHEVAVRPKETILSKRKGLSLSGGGGMLVRLGGSVSLALEDGGGKCIYKGAASSSGGKLKLTQGGGKVPSTGGTGGNGGIGSSKHASTKRRTSSEDSSLEPDLADLSLDDSCNLALGAEACNTFEFLPAPTEVLPSQSPLLRDSPKFSRGSSGSKSFKMNDISHVPAALTAAESSPACFPSKENIDAAVDTADREAEVAIEPVNCRNKDICGNKQPSSSTMTIKSDTHQASAKSSWGKQNSEAEPSGAAAAGSDVAANQGNEAIAGASEGEALAEDDYQAYYLSAASEEGADKQLADSHQEEEPDIFAGIKPLEQTGRMEVRK